MEVGYRVFRGTWTSWDDLFTDAARFAGEIGLARLINISHAVAGQDGTVTVWYWEVEEDDEPAVEPPPDPIV
jgi:hypothetical protein